MPDIFGREPEDYAVVRGYQEAGLWEQRQQALAARLPHANPTHNFRAMGQLPEFYARAEPNAQVIGYIVNSLQAVQTAVDEVLYLKYRLPDYMPMNLDMPEGADSYLVRILDRTGRGQFITNPGTDAPVAGVSQRTENQRLYYAGIDALWTIEDARRSLLSGVALDIRTIEAAVEGAMDHMEAVGLLGTDEVDGAPKGLVNFGTGAGKVNLQTQDGSMTFDDLTGPADLRADRRRHLLGDRDVPRDLRDQHHHGHDGLPADRAVQPALVPLHRRQPGTLDHAGDPGGQPLDAAHGQPGRVPVDARAPEGRGGERGPHDRRLPRRPRVRDGRLHHAARHRGHVQGPLRLRAGRIQVLAGVHEAPDGHALPGTRSEMARKPAQSRTAAAAPREDAAPPPTGVSEDRVLELIAEEFGEDKLGEAIAAALEAREAETPEPEPEPVVARGMLVEIHQTIRGKSRWLPFLVTHVHEEDGDISGVAMSGLPAQTSWMRAAQDFAHVKQGEDNRCWRFLRLEPEGDG